MTNLLNKKILIIDDEISIRNFLKISFESHKCIVKESESGNQGLQDVVSFKPDLIILDLGLPDQTGIEVLKKLRDWSNTPVIVLTVQDSDADKVLALDQGADDYITKPFSVPELLARSRVALRHSKAKETKEPIFKNGSLEINYTQRSVKINETLIKLTVTEYDILKFMSEHVGKVITHRMLLKAVWGPNAVEHNHYLRIYLGHLRKKLKINDTVPDFFETESGVGYRLKVIDPSLE